MEHELPSGHEFVSLAAKERVTRNMSARRHQDETMERIGPRALGPADGLIDPVSWDGKAIPARKWIVPGLIPANTVTLLTGNGGDGKSLLALQLLKCCVTNTRWLGRHVKQVRGIGIWCEDDADELQRRSDGTLSPEGLDFTKMEGLTFFDRDGQDNVMYEAGYNDPIGRTTIYYERVWETVRKDGAEILVLDSLYNFFGGNENVRGQANDFIGQLKRMCRKLGVAIILVAHPSRAGMGQGGDGTAGNTGWHNSVRSRLYLHRLKHPSGDPEKKGPLVLEHMKANYGPKEDRIEVTYDQGRFVNTAEPSHLPSQQEERAIWAREEAGREGDLS